MWCGKTTADNNNKYDIKMYEWRSKIEYFVMQVLVVHGKNVETYRNIEKKLFYMQIGKWRKLMAADIDRFSKTSELLVWGDELIVNDDFKACTIWLHF